MIIECSFSAPFSGSAMNIACGVVRPFLYILVFFVLWDRSPFLPRPICVKFLLIFVHFCCIPLNGRSAARLFIRFCSFLPSSNIGV